MTVLYVLIGALAVLLSLLLCGFVGCNWVFGLKETSLIPPAEGNYPDVVKGEPSIVAYWRLGEPSTTPVPSSGGAARDELGNFNGDYFKLNPVTFPDVIRHSPDHSRQHRHRGLGTSRIRALAEQHLYRCRWRVGASAL